MQIHVTETKGTFSEKLVSRTVGVTMSPERFETEKKRVENGTLRYLDDFERGEHYD